MTSEIAYFVWKTLDSNDQNQAAGQRFSLKQCFAEGAQSRWIRKPGFKGLLTYFWGALLRI